MSADRYCVYLLRCCDGSLYCGIATDLDRRVKQHNEGKGARYTAAHRPVVLEYSTGKWFARAEAQAIELRVKRKRRVEKRPFLEKLEGSRETRAGGTMQVEGVPSVPAPGFNQPVP